jgi:urease gamma subunit
MLSEATESATAPDTALGQARLKKTLLEIERLQILVENERLEQRRLKGELLFRQEAVALVTAPQQAIATVLRDLGKRMAVLLAGQPVGAIERTLNDWVADTMQTAESAVVTVAAI